MSILQKNLLKINLLDNKSIADAKNIFGSTKLKISYNKNIKSTNLVKHKFVNYINSKNKALIKKLKTDERKFIDGLFDFDKDFKIKYLLDENNMQAKFDDILLNTLGTTTNVLSCVRLKTPGNVSLQYIVSDNFTGAYEIIVIDLYHLLVFAADKSRGEKKPKPKRTYNEHKDDNKCISKVLNSI